MGAQLDNDQPAPRPDPLEGWIHQDGEHRVLRLEEPVSLGKAADPVTQLRFAKVRARQLREMKSHDMDGLLRLVEAATSESRRVIDNLCVADALRAVEVVQLDFPDGPSPGGPT